MNELLMNLYHQSLSILPVTSNLSSQQRYKLHSQITNNCGNLFIQSKYTSTAIHLLIQSSQNILVHLNPSKSNLEAENSSVYNLALALLSKKNYSEAWKALMLVNFEENIELQSMLWYRRGECALALYELEKKSKYEPIKVVGKGVYRRFMIDCDDLKGKNSWIYVLSSCIGACLACIQVAVYERTPSSSECEFMLRRTQVYALILLQYAQVILKNNEMVIEIGNILKEMKKLKVNEGLISDSQMISSSLYVCESYFNLHRNENAQNELEHSLLILKTLESTVVSPNSMTIQNRIAIHANKSIVFIHSNQHQLAVDELEQGWTLFMQHYQNQLPPLHLILLKLYFEILLERFEVAKGILRTYISRQ